MSEPTTTRVLATEAPDGSGRSPRTGVLATQAVRWLGALLFAWLLPWCGYRTRGLEVTLELSADAVPGTLHVERVELLPCPDDARSAWWPELLGARVASAHDQPTAMGPTTLAGAAPRDEATLPIAPGSYCDVRVHFGAPDVPALTMGAETAAERETVLRLVDEEGTPTRLTMAGAPDHRTVHVALGAFSSDDTPAHALSRVIEGARATLLAP